MCISGKKLHLALSDCSFEGKESSPIWVIQWNFSTFQCDVDYFPHESVCAMQRET